MWIFTAQDRVDANKVPLHIKRLDVMRDSKQVRFRWQLVSRVSPVTAAKEAQLPAGHKGLDAVLDTLKKAGSAQHWPPVCFCDLSGDSQTDPNVGEKGLYVTAITPSPFLRLAWWLKSS